MSRTRLLFIAVATASILAAPTNPAFGIQIVIGSATRIPFSQSYPEQARTKVRASLGMKHCAFIDGYSSMQVTTLNFAGDAKAVNAQLKNLASCPAATVTVAFEKLDHQCDWRVVHRVSANQFDVIVNLNSKQLALEKLTIPPAKGPRLSCQESSIADPTE